MNTDSLDTWFQTARVLNDEQNVTKEIEKGERRSCPLQAASAPRP